MRQVTLNRVNQNPIPDVVHAYGMTLTVTSADDMPTEVFVKQRLSADGTQDQFAAIASPAQLEDLLANEPSGDTSYYRSSTVSFVVANPARLEEIYNQVVAEVQALVYNLNILDLNVTPDTNCVITADSVSVT